MTELETQLLSALEALQNKHEQQQAAWQEAYSALQTMFEDTQTDTKALRQSVDDLSKQVLRLASQVITLQG